MTDHRDEGPYLIIGLGNPGRAHRANRHNVGFMLLDRLAAGMGITFTRRKSDALISDGRVEGTRVILAKPQTFMNLSGRSVGSLVSFYQIPLPRLLVVCDELDLPLGVMRLRPGGGSAGHKGLRSIFEHLGTQEFPRLRIGIGRPPGRMDPADYVLQDFGEQERGLVDTTLERAEACVWIHIRQGIQAAMTRFNTSQD